MNVMQNIEMIKESVLKDAAYMQELELLASRMRWELEMVMDMPHLKNKEMEENTTLRVTIRTLLKDYDDYTQKPI